MLDSLLRLGRAIGLLGFLGGLAALAAMWFCGPAPADAPRWHMLMQLTSMVFYRCMFAGILVLAVTGSLSWWRGRKRYHGKRWFGIMLLLLAIAIPTLHLWARFTMLKIHAAVDAGNLAAADDLWQHMGTAYLVSVLVLVPIAAIGFIKPRFGQPDADGRD